MGVDAEHRRVVTPAGESGCVFCAIIERRQPAAIVLETPAVVAFAARRQQVPGHVLVVPRRHVETIYDLARDAAAEMMTAAIDAARALRDAFAPQGLSLWQSNGDAAFQEIAHVHLNAAALDQRRSAARLPQHAG